MSTTIEGAAPAPFFEGLFIDNARKFYKFQHALWWIAPGGRRVVGRAVDGAVMNLSTPAFSCYEDGRLAVLLATEIWRPPLP